MKDFLIIGNLNAVTYKEVFPLIKEGEVRLGVNSRMDFAYQGERINGIASVWFTTLTHDHVNPPITLTKRYTPADYPKYDNYDAIDVSRTEDIPCDYDGTMGVPISFLDKYCPEQFEIVDMAHRGAGKYLLRTKVYTAKDSPYYSTLNATAVLIVDGIPQPIYFRILIRRR